MCVSKEMGGLHDKMWGHLACDMAQKHPAPPKKKKKKALKN